MATLTQIDPNKGKRTGDTPFSITGTGFNTSDLSDDFSGAPFYTDISASGGSILDTTKLTLTVDTTVGSIAGVDTTHVFARSFDVSILTDYDITTLPSYDGVKITGLRAFDDADPTTYFEITLRYNNGTGYFLSVDGFITGSAVYSTTTAIDPNNVDGLRIVRSEDRMTAYIKISGQFAKIGTFLGFSTFDSKIKFFSENTSTSLPQPYNIDITNYNVGYVISLVNQPAIVLTTADTEITGRTEPNEVGTGDVVVGFPDGTFAELINAFEYTEKEGLILQSDNFDTVISVFNFHIQPSRNELFTSAGAFVWDDNYWISPEKQNKNLFVPSLWDAATANVPRTFLQSGYGDDDNIEFIDIKRFRAESEESWHARINHGTYFIKNLPYFLYSHQSITTQLGVEQTTDGRSKQNLKFLPKPGIPITASTLTTDQESSLIVDKKRFSKRGKFTGKVQNGIELDTDVVSNIDDTLSEFVVTYNSNNKKINHQIPTAGAVAGEFSFDLPSVPIKCFGVIFSRVDIFSTEKSLGKFYGDSETIYGEVLYGEPLTDPGDYSIDYQTGEVRVVLDQEYFDLGYITYTFDFPAVIEFNNDYLVDKGLGITDPTPSDLNDLDNIGESNGSPTQILRLEEFPALDFSDEVFLDTDNFNLFLYDPSDNTFETDWVRVRRFTDSGPSDKHYTLNPDKGLVVFGNDIQGAIPTKYKQIIAGYKTSVRIEYEPVSSVDFWVGDETDLNLSKNNLDSGFLFLSRKELIPDNISIQWSTNEIDALEFADLTAIVRDRDGDPVPFTELEFEIISGNGNLEEEIVTTDSNGVAKTTFIPSTLIQNMAIFTQLYEAGVDPETVGDEILAYSSSGILTNNILAAEEVIDDVPGDVYLFKIYDNDDPFLPYNAQTRTGGVYQALFEFDIGSGQNELIRPTAINGNILIFDVDLPQPFNASEPNYEPNLRGFAIIGKRQVQAKARVDTGLFIIDSDIATLRLSYSPIQKGEWTLPIAPTSFEGSEISRATYITINP